MIYNDFKYKEKVANQSSLSHCVGLIMVFLDSKS